MRNTPASIQPWLIAMTISVLAHAWALQRRTESPEIAVPSTISVRVLLPTPQAQPSQIAPTPPSRHRAIPQAAPPLVEATPAALAFAPAAEWTYRLSQNGKEGTARLSWQPQEDGRYFLTLERELAGHALPGWRSQGRIGPLGLEPERYAVQRKGRDSQATNFRREEGLISYSASAELVALQAGVQDRLSLLLQLAAQIAADPGRYGRGSDLTVHIAGLRGEPQPWRFEVLGTEPCLHLRRPPPGLFEPGMELCLDPTRRHLPVLLRAIAPPEAPSQAWDMRLESELAP